MTERMLQRVSHALVVTVVSTLVLFLVVAVTYALYLFLHVTNLPEAAGLHFSKNIFLEYKNLKGELYTNKEKGIENWLILEDEKNGLKIKYPNDYKIQQLADGAELKNYNTEAKGNESLAMTVYVEKRDNAAKENVEQVLAERGIAWQEEWTKRLQNGEIADGQQLFETEVVKDGKGINHKMVFWKSAQGVVFAEGIFFKDKPEEQEQEFALIVSELRIL